MNTEFFMNGQPLQLRSGFPQDYKGVLICGSQPASVVTSMASIVLQDIRCEWFTLRHQVIRWFRETTLYSHYHEKGLQATIALREPQTKKIIGTGSMHLQEGEYGALLTKAYTTLQELKGKGITVTLDLLGTEAFCQEIFSNDPAYLREIKNCHHGFPHLLGRPYRTLTDQMKEIIEEILFCPFEEPLCTEMRKEAVQQLLEIVFAQATNLDWKDENISDRDRRVVADAAQLIDTNLHHHLPINKIATRVGTNEYKLKRCFRQVMRMGMHQYLIDRRLQIIRQEILLTNKPIKAFYKQAGYSSLGAFVTGFGRHFDCPPGHLRLKK